jgi:hypothetical protein
MPSHLRNAAENAITGTVTASVSAGLASVNYATYRVMIAMVKGSEDPDSFIEDNLTLLLILEALGLFATATAAGAVVFSYKSLKFFDSAATNLKKAILGAPQEELQEALNNNPAVPHA